MGKNLGEGDEVCSTAVYECRMMQVGVDNPSSHTRSGLAHRADDFLWPVWDGFGHSVQLLFLVAFLCV